MPALAPASTASRTSTACSRRTQNGDVGPAQYVQVVNLSFAVYEKTGSVLYGPANINTLFSGFLGRARPPTTAIPLCSTTSSRTAD
jgi:hypothetical protein